MPLNDSSRTDAAPPAHRLRPMPAPLAYTLADARAVSGLSRSTIYRLGRAGRVRLVKVGGRTLVDAASLCALISGAA